MSSNIKTIPAFSFVTALVDDALGRNVYNRQNEFMADKQLWNNQLRKDQKCAIDDFRAKFRDDDACLDYIMEHRHPGQVAVCDKCKVDRKHYRIAGRKVYPCEPWIPSSPDKSQRGRIRCERIRRKASTPTQSRVWSLIKRGIGRTHHAVSAKYLQEYLNEYSFRYNRRDVPRPMVTQILERVCEKAE